MNKLQTVLLLILLFSISTIFGQERNGSLGIKGGANYGKYTPNQNLIEYNNLLGFYVGGFYNIQIEPKLQFQPELLFALQGSKIKTKDNLLTDINGNPIPYTSTFDFEYEIYELTISVPLPIKLYVSKEFYIESGPQFGFIVNRKITASQYLLDGNDNSFVKLGGDNFDFGVCLGTGYDINKQISLNIRAYTGLIKRDNDIKSIVLNFGIEYNL
jgi:hypothetical protein